MACYDVMAELASDDLVEGAHRVGLFEGEVVLLLESQEDGYLARVLRPAGPDVVGVGAPVAVLCEQADEVRVVVCLPLSPLPIGSPYPTAETARRFNPRSKASRPSRRTSFRRSTCTTTRHSGCSEFARGRLT